MTNTAPNTAKKPPSKLWLYGPIALFVLLIGAYCAYWVIVHGKLEASVDEWISKQRAAGAQVEFSDKRLGGFPYRFALELDAPHFTDASGNTDWQGERLQIVMQPWNFKHAIIRSPGRNELVQAGRNPITAILGKKSAASFKWNEQGLTNFGLNLDTADLVTAGGDFAVTALTANLVQMEGPQQGARLSLDWGGVSLDPSLLQGTDLAFLGTEIQASRVRLEGKGFGLFGEAPSRDVEIAQFQLNWGPVKFGAKGKFDINAGGYPDGTLQVRIDEADVLARALRDEGLLTSETALIFGPLAAASRDNGFFPIPLRNGAITILGQSLGGVPPVAPPLAEAAQPS